MSVKSKPLHVIRSSDIKYPVLFFMDRPEILTLAIYDHKNNTRQSIKSVKNLNTQIKYEITHFVVAKGKQIELHKLYRGVAVFSYHNKLKMIMHSQTELHYH